MAVSGTVVHRNQPFRDGAGFGWYLVTKRIYPLVSGVYTVGVITDSRPSLLSSHRLLIRFGVSPAPYF